MPPPSHTHQEFGGRARIAAVATHLPERVLDNDTLALEFDGWSAAKILEKTGIAERRIAAEGETALDLGEAAARKLLSKVSPEHPVDFLIVCTQAGDHILPSSACILQDRLALPTSIGALDINLGCSGFVYGLSLASGLIASGAARAVLLVTADTYSKYVNPLDKSVRTLFGDGAAATLIVAEPATGGAGIGPFVFGTDGSGAGDLIVQAGGFRLPSSPKTAREEEDRSGNIRSPDDLYMDGAAVLTFSLREVPRAYHQLLDTMGAGPDDVDLVLLHQANKFMLDALQRKLDLPDHKLPRRYKDIGNTVSSTIPFVLASLLDDDLLPAGTRTVMIGFGVGLSWAAASVVF